jgi:hypothetical protein
MFAMPRVNFTPNLRRHLVCETQTVTGTVRAALDRVFAENPALRTYVLDDQHIGEPVKMTLAYPRDGTLYAALGGMDIDGSGERLAVGSTTGALWVSNK